MDRENLIRAILDRDCNALIEAKAMSMEKRILYFLAGEVGGGELLWRDEAGRNTWNSNGRVFDTEGNEHQYADLGSVKTFVRPLKCMNPADLPFKLGGHTGFKFAFKMEIVEVPCY